MEEMHWEEGWRCHGLWCGLKRVAIVTLTPRVLGQATEYRWSVGEPGPKQLIGQSKKLQQAKRAVMRIVNHLDPSHTKKGAFAR